MHRYIDELQRQKDSLRRAKDTNSLSCGDEKAQELLLQDLIQILTKKESSNDDVVGQKRFKPSFNLTQDEAKRPRYDVLSKASSQKNTHALGQS